MHRGRYRQFERKRSSHRRGGEGSPHGLRPLYLVQPTFTPPAATKSYDRLVLVNVISRPGAQRRQPLHRHRQSAGCDRPAARDLCPILQLAHKSHELLCEPDEVATRFEGNTVFEGQAVRRLGA